MKRIGLTGGIASGKTTVARLLESMGVPVLDADQLSRKVVLPGQPAHAEIAERWPEVIGPDGAIDRAKLGARVFRNPAELRELTGLVLPRIVDEIERGCEALAGAGQPFCVVEAATLFEENLEHLVDGVLLVSLAPDEQIRRLRTRTGLSEEDARLRLAAQLPLETKRQRSRWVLDNSGPEAELPEKVRAMWQRVVREA